MGTYTMIYNSFTSDLVSGNISPSQDQFFLMLVHGYEFHATDARRSDVEASEVVASGYDKGGKHCAVTIGKADGQVTLLFSDVKWDISGSLSATGGVLYKSRGGAPSFDELVTYVDFGKIVSCTDSTFTAHFASGLGIGTK